MIGYSMAKLPAELGLLDLGSRRRKPSWLIPQSRGYSGLPPNFETQDVCFERQLVLTNRLMTTTSASLPVVRQLFACMCLPYPCRRPFCPQCARSFRMWCLDEFTSLVKGFQRNSNIVTVILQKVPRSALRSIKLRAVKARLRTICVRSALRSSTVCGGIEVSYDWQQDIFILHAHLMVIDATSHQLSSLRPLFRKSSGARSVKVQPLRHPQAQISYLLKFNTFHRPGSQFGSHRARAVPLPLPALEALVAWWAQYEVSDFVFLYRARVVHGRVKPTVPAAMRPP